MRRFLAAGIVILTLGGCASSMNTYSREDTGRIIETTPGTVLSSRPVSISGSRSGAGAVAGGVTGGVIGATSIGGNSGALAGVLLGLAGALVGSVAEEAITSGSGHEYTIQTDDGRVVTVVQRQEGEQPPLPAGTPVRVQWGTDYSRVIPAPGATPAAGSAPPPGGARPADDGWINPDATTGATPAPTTGRTPAATGTSGQPPSDIRY